MDALILSCATGGGHHAAAQAMQEELRNRGHHVDLLDPYTLTGKRMEKKIGNCYVKCVQNAPKVFGMVYLLGDLYRRIPGKSPVYWANGKMADYLREYLDRNSYDVILTTHLFPGEILTHLKRKGMELPKIIYISTDYTCIPFTEEIECDYFIVPSKEQEREYCQWGIAPEKVVSIGIPVKQAFREKEGRRETAKRLGLDDQKNYILLAGGSMGSGGIAHAACVLEKYLKDHKELVEVVICGTNRRLYRKLERRYRNKSQVLLLKRTKDMAEYLRLCDLYISKPGGLSSTEAAVANVPLIHISPIPGCETKNKRFFVDHGMSFCVSDMKRDLLQTVERLKDRDVIDGMRRAQQETVDPLAAEKIAVCAERVGRK